jgi:hypothetical protein
LIESSRILARINIPANPQLFSSSRNTKHFDYAFLNNLPSYFFKNYSRGTGSKSPSKMEVFFANGRQWVVMTWFYEIVRGYVYSLGI